MVELSLSSPFYHIGKSLVKARRAEVTALRLVSTRMRLLLFEF